jgi:hypothetical protein
LFFPPNSFGIDFFCLLYYLLGLDWVEESGSGPSYGDEGTRGEGLGEGSPHGLCMAMAMAMAMVLMGTNELG